MKLKKSNCKNCYKCIRHCPVKSIRFSGNQAHIVGNECILCGQCFVVCPQDAKQIADDTEKVKVMIGEGGPVIASIAPSFAANYPESGIEEIRKAVKQLGFADAEETALGATVVKKEYERLLEEEKRNVVISSCCHSVNLLIQKYFPHLLPLLADVVSPMQAHCADIKKRYPTSKTVFIGPCLAKKDEAEYYGDTVDAVLTFEDLTRWMTTENIVLEQGRDSSEKSRARLFPVAGGIINTMDKRSPEYRYITVDGVENCIEALKEIEKGALNKCFIEMSSCIGSCIGGPVIEKSRKNPLRNYIEITGYAGKEDFDIDMPEISELRKDIEPIDRKLKMPSDSDIDIVLKQMGKKKKEDELNCGSCGYNTCREKAIAICQGKADLTMCLPFLKDKAESFSDTIIRNTPNGILVLNENLEIQQVNKAALKIMNVQRASDIMGEQVIRVLDPKVFMDVKMTGRGIHDQRVYFTEYNRYVEQSIIFDREYKILICLMRDVTEEEIQRDKKETISRQTVEIADKVVDKQMRIVQEIASLLGETAAETKIALTKLKESIADE